MAEGGLVQALPGVQADGDLVRAAAGHQPGQLHGEGGIPAEMAGGLFPVDEDGGLVGRAVQGEEEPLAAPLRRELQSAAVPADHLVVALVGIVEGQLPAGVGEAHGGGVALEAEKGIVKALGEFPAVVERSSDHDIGPFRWFIWAAPFKGRPEPHFVPGAYHKTGRGGA